MGDIGKQKNVRSWEAIKNWAVPVSHIDRVTLRIMEINIPISHAKFVCTNHHYDVAREWHRFGKYCNETYHYSLKSLKEVVESYGKDKIAADYKESQNKKKEKRTCKILLEICLGKIC